MDIVILILISTLRCTPGVTISTHHVRAVSPHDYYRNAPLPPDKTNWEIGLKEATYQALLREQNTDPHLKQEIYASSIEGYQDSATPFGDIAVIARGQLYSNAHGYQFIQDPYQNDCDDCHTPHNHRCERGQCEPQASQNIDDLLALWTVKRIRHRDTKFGHRYELQYTISPMNPAANARFVTRNGRFDYSIPGHVFIVKLKEDGAETRLENIRTNFRFDKEHRSTNHRELKTPWLHHRHQVGSNDEEIVHHKAQAQNHYHNTPNSILLNTGEYYLAHKAKPTDSDQGFNPGFLISISPNGYKHVVHDIPNIASNNGPYVDSKPFIPSHHAPPTTKEPVKHYHHHFYIPEVEDIDYDDHKIVRPTVPTASTKEPHQFVTGFRPTIPHKFILTTMHQQNGADTTPKQVYTPETTQVVPPLTTYSTYKYPETTVPIAISPTIFTEPNYVENPTYPRTTLLKVFTVPATHPTQPTPFSPSPFYVQYSDPDPTYNNNQPPTVPTFVAQTIQTTGQPTYYTVQEETVEPKTKTLVGIFEEIPTTAPTTATPTITTKKMKYHNSINSQLPPPEKGSDTTVPYVSSTAVTILSTSSRDNDDENDAESSDRKSTTIQDTIQTTTAVSVNESTEPMINSIFTTKFEAVSTVFPTQSDETTTLTASTDNLITTTTLATTLQTENPKDSSGEDIFGTVSIPRKSKPKVVYSDEFDIFGGSKKPKDTTTERLKPIETVSTSKRPNAYDEIFGEFKSSTEKTKLLTPHTSLSVSPESALRNARISKYLKYKRNKSDRLSKFRANKEAEKINEEATVTNVTDVAASERNDIETKTSQSLITSISFKVNKNKYGGAQLSSTQASNVVQDEMKDVMKADMIEVNKNDTDFKVYKANLPDSIKTTTDQSQTFDDIAQTLVNHARVANFLNGKITKPTKRTYRLSLR